MAAKRTRSSRQPSPFPSPKKSRASVSKRGGLSDLSNEPKRRKATGTGGSKGMVENDKDEDDDNKDEVEIVLKEKAVDSAKKAKPASTPKAKADRSRGKTSPNKNAKIEGRRGLVSSSPPPPPHTRKPTNLISSSPAVEPPSRSLQALPPSHSSKATSVDEELHPWLQIWKHYSFFLYSTPVILFLYTLLKRTPEHLAIFSWPFAYEAFRLLPEIAVYSGFSLLGGYVLVFVPFIVTVKHLPAQQERTEDKVYIRLTITLIVLGLTMLRYYLAHVSSK